MNNPTLLMLIGLPCSGKSTWVKNQKILKDYTIIDTDSYIDTRANDLNLTYNDVFDSEIKHANHAMNNKIMSAITSDNNIIWDQTNLAGESRVKKLNKIPEHYYKVAVVFDIDQGTIYNRLDARSKSGKDIPLHVIKNMLSQYSRPQFHEGFDAIMYITEDKCFTSFQ